MTNKNKIVLLRRVLTDLGYDKEIHNEEVTEAIDNGINTFMKNPYFVKEYESIPTNTLRCHELLVWTVSAGYREQTVYNMLSAIDDAFTLDEWQWLIDNTPNITAKNCWSKTLKVKRLEADFKEDENIQYYYMDDINRVGKAEHYINTDGVECSRYYLYEVDKGWVEDNCEITDHQMGYDPTEDDFYKFGNTEIMASLHKITAQEAVELLKKGIN